MAAEMREKPVLTGEDARRFIEREQQVNTRRQEQLRDSKIIQVKKGFSLWTLPVER